MTLPASGELSLEEILEEFGAPAGTPLDAMVRGGAYVPHDDLSGENSGIPTSTPISIEDFYSANGNPNPYQLKDFVLPMQRGQNSGLLVLANLADGIFVQGYDGVTEPPPDNTMYVVDAKLRVTTNHVDEPNIGPVNTEINNYATVQKRLGVQVGLTTVDPALNSAQNVINGMLASSHSVNFYATEEDEGFAYAEWPGDHQSGASASRYLENSAPNSTYIDDVLPTSSQAVTMRWVRGINDLWNTHPNGLNTIDHAFYVWDNENWSGSAWKQRFQIGRGSFNYNTGGWLVMRNLGSHPLASMDIYIEDLRVYSGDWEVPW